MYYEKYLKYKTKYTELKYGGSNLSKNKIQKQPKQQIKNEKQTVEDVIINMIKNCYYSAFKLSKFLNIQIITPADLFNDFLLTNSEILEEIASPINEPINIENYIWITIVNNVKIFNTIKLSNFFKGGRFNAQVPEKTKEIQNFIKYTITINSNPIKYILVDEYKIYNFILKRVATNNCKNREPLAPEYSYLLNQINQFEYTPSINIKNDIKKYIEQTKKSTPRNVLPNITDSETMKPPSTSNTLLQSLLPSPTESETMYPPQPPSTSNTLLQSLLPSPTESETMYPPQPPNTSNTLLQSLLPSPTESETMYPPQPPNTSNTLLPSTTKLNSSSQLFDNFLVDNTLICKPYPIYNMSLFTEDYLKNYLLLNTIYRKHRNKKHDTIQVVTTEKDVLLSYYVKNINYLEKNTDGTYQYDDLMISIKDDNSLLWTFDTEIEKKNKKYAYLSDDIRNWIKSFRIIKETKNINNFITYKIFVKSFDENTKKPTYIYKDSIHESILFNNIYKYIKNQNDARTKNKHNTNNCVICDMYNTKKNEIVSCDNIPTNHYTFTSDVYCVLLIMDDNQLKIPIDENKKDTIPKNYEKYYKIIDYQDIGYYYFVSKTKYHDPANLILSFNNLNSSFRKALLDYCNRNNDLLIEKRNQRKINQDKIKRIEDTIKMHNNKKQDKKQYIQDKIQALSKINKYKNKNNMLKKEMNDITFFVSSLVDISSFVYCGPYLTKKFILSICECPLIVNNVDAIIDIFYKIHQDSSIDTNQEFTFRTKLLEISTIQHNINKNKNYVNDNNNRGNHWSIDFNNYLNNIINTEIKKKQTEDAIFRENIKNTVNKQPTPTNVQGKSKNTKIQTNVSVKQIIENGQTIDINPNQLYLVKASSYRELCNLPKLTIEDLPLYTLTDNKKIELYELRILENSYEWILGEHCNNVLEYNILYAALGDSRYNGIDKNSEDIILEINDKSLFKKIGSINQYTIPKELNDKKILIAYNFKNKQTKNKNNKVVKEICYIHYFDDFKTILEAKFKQIKNIFDAQYTDIMSKFFNGNENNLTPDELGLCLIQNHYFTINEMLSKRSKLLNIQTIQLLPDDVKETLKIKKKHKTIHIEDDVVNTSNEDDDANTYNEDDVVNTYNENNVVNTPNEDDVVNTSNENVVVNTPNEDDGVNTYNEDDVVNTYNEYDGVNTYNEYDGVNTYNEDDGVNTYNEDDGVNTYNEYDDMTYEDNENDYTLGFSYGKTVRNLDNKSKKKKSEKTISDEKKKEKKKGKGKNAFNLKNY